MRSNVIVYPGKSVPWTTLNTREASDKLRPGELQSISNFTFESLGALKKHGGNTEITSATLTTFSLQPTEDQASTANVYWDSTGAVRDTVHLAGSNIGLLFDLSTVTGTVQSASLILKSGTTDTLGGNLYRATSAFTDATASAPTYDTSSSVAFSSDPIVDASNTLTIPAAMMTTMISTNYGFLLNVTTGTGAFQAPWVTLGFCCGGLTDSGSISTIQLIEDTLITGDSASSTSLIAASHFSTGVSGSTYNFIAAGVRSGVASNVIEYISRATIFSNSVDTGDLTVTRYSCAGISGTTYGFICGGFGGGAFSNVIDYLTLVTTTQNATDSGDLTVARSGLGGLSGSTYGFIMGGVNTSGYSNVIDYITLANATGNATDTGDLTLARQRITGIQGATYGFGVSGTTDSFGIYAVHNIIDYITLATQTQNAIDTGDLTVVRAGVAGTSGATYGFIMGGDTDTSGLDTIASNVIDYITLATTTQNALDRGDLLTAVGFSAGAN